MASVTDAEKALCSTNGKENFQRLTRLLMCGGVRLLRETFDSIHPPKDLPLKLGDPATRSQLKKAKLSRAEWSCLYPLTGTFGKSIEFDITLTFRLLRTICNLTPPVTGWDSLPSSADRSFEADLARIKFYRNSIYGHNHKMEVSDSDFCNLWKEISEALLRIANYHGPGKTDEWKKSIGKLLTDPLTSEAQSFVEELELWYKKDMEVKDQLQDQFQEVNEKLDLLITFELESFSRRGQPLAHLYSGPRSAGMTSLSIPEQQPQFAVAEATSGENQGGDQNPSEEPDIWKVILSFKESFRLLLDYLSSQLKLRILSYGSGSLSITAACSSLEILEGLWKDYCSGHLNTVAEKILFTSEVLKRLSLSEVKLRTIIKEEDYHKLKQCLVDEDQLKKAESCVHLSLRSDATNKSSVNVHYILIENITLIKGQDYRTSKLLTGEELERGTILQQDPRDKTRFVLADRQEVFFYESCFEGLDDKLKRLSDALAKMLLEIASLGERLQLFNRLVGRGNPGQRKSMSLNDPRSGEHNPDLKSRLSRLSRFLRGKGVRKEKIDPELKVNQRVVTFIEDDVFRGTVRHIGEEKDSNGIVQKILGLEMDKMLSIGGCGRRNGRQLFSCEEGFSLFIPVESVMLDREFDAEPEALETPEEEEEESSEEFDSQSDDDSSEMGIDIVSVERKLEVKQDHYTPSNPQEEEYREWEEDWKMQSTTLQEGMTNCKVESDHAWDETVTLYRQLMEQSIPVEEFRELEGRLREEITEKDARQAVLCEQFKEKDQQLKEMKQQLTATEEREEDLKTQIRNVEEQLRKNEDRVENLRTNLRDAEQRLTQNEAQEENLRSILKLTEERMREELAEKETRETELCEQLGEKEERALDLQRRLSEMEQQMSEKNDEKQTLLRQLTEMEQRSREETAEIEMRENGFREQLREGEQKLREIRKQLTEKEKQEENLRTQLRVHLMEQQLKEEMIEEATGLGEQLRERDQQIENLQMQLGQQHEQLREREEQLANVRMQLEERDPLRTDFQHQFEEIEAENANLRQQVDNLQNQLGTQSHDWIISRDDIQLTDKTLGVGGWGEVFEGKYCGCSVAVKRIHAEIFSPYNQNLFQREIDIASRCRHPCLLQFIGATNDEDIPLFVTELMESNLRELLRQRSLSHREIAMISLDVARALNYLHQRRPLPILHRDVSSSNVLLWRQNNQWRGKVSDYGSPKFEEQFMSIGPGCFAYSAPEVQKSENQTAKIDVYSFGVLLCEMCIHTFPDYQNREHQIALVTDCVLQDLIRRCLRSDPSERPDMTEIVSRLEQFNETL